jgi:hypothetical protein
MLLGGLHSQRLSRIWAQTTFVETKLRRDDVCLHNLVLVMLYHDSRQSNNIIIDLERRIVNKGC